MRPAAASLLIVLSAAAAACGQNPADLTRQRFAARELFFAGRFDDCIAAFDKLAAAAPGIEASLWERGLAYYYAGRYKDAVRQFTGYDTVDKLDIENGLWHYLSTARIEGLEAARKNILKYEQRRREPFPALLDLYVGKGAPEAVLKSAEDGVTDKLQLKLNRFFAHLYLGKWHQVHGRHREALPHFEKAVADEITASEFASGHFMWHCARVDLERTRAEVRGDGRPK